MKPQALRLEGRNTIFERFSGEPDQYHDEGDISFSILFDDVEEAEELLDLGWALRPLTDEDDKIDGYHLPVKVRYRNRKGQLVRYPPRVWRVVEPDENDPDSRGTRVLLDEDTIAALQYLPIKYVDVLINPYEWSVQGKVGVSAYCGELWAVMKPSRLDIKYRDYDVLGDSSEA